MLKIKKILKDGSKLNDIRNNNKNMLLILFHSVVGSIILSYFLIMLFKVSPPELETEIDYIFMRINVSLVMLLFSLLIFIFVLNLMKFISLRKQIKSTKGNISLFTERMNLLKKQMVSLDNNEFLELKKEFFDDVRVSFNQNSFINKKLNRTNPFKDMIEDELNDRIKKISGLDTLDPDKLLLQNEKVKNKKKIENI